jgi:hypothetical protein
LNVFFISRKSSKTDKPTNLNHASKGTLAAGCFSQNVSSGFFEMTCISHHIANCYKLQSTDTDSVAPPPPPLNPAIVAVFGPSNDINVGTVAQFQVATTNATDASIACTGLWPASGPITPNLGWGGDLITYNYIGKTNFK